MAQLKPELDGEDMADEACNQLSAKAYQTGYMFAAEVVEVSVESVALPDKAFL
jgi:hypothetical protein